MSEKKEEFTDFGFQKIKKKLKENKVKAVFDNVASHYDCMNDVMSLGIHRLWKKITIKNANVQAGMKVLDLAGGTGDLSRNFMKQVGSKGQVILADINYNMIKIGRDKLRNLGLIHDITYIQANAEQLPFQANQFDVITIAFGLRNVTDKKKALIEMYRILKPGGKLLILEFSKPKHKIINQCYDFYSFNIIPKMGKLIANDSESYQYLSESIRMHPNQEALKDLILDSHFDAADYINLSQGIVALHRGYKF